MLHLKDFRKNYGSKVIIQVPEYTFEPGVHWIKGQNGSGKTTLFKSIAGIVPFQGHVTLSGLSSKADPIDYRLIVNYAEAEPVFPSVVKGMDLVALFEKYKKAPEGQAASISASLGIKFLEESFGTYSSGMGKKLSLLLAFLGKPKLILLDEPLVTLDSTSVEAMLGLINSYKKLYSTSFLISSHQAFEEGHLQPDFCHEISNQQINAIRN